MALLVSMDQLKRYQLVLGSASPRRNEILQILTKNLPVGSLTDDPPFRIEVSTCEEDMPESVKQQLISQGADSYVMALAMKKADEIGRRVAEAQTARLQ